MADRMNKSLRIIVDLLQKYRSEAQGATLFDGRRSKPSSNVYDPGDDADFACVPISLIAVSFGQDAEELEATDAMLDADTKTAECMVVIAFFRGQGLVLGFLVRDVDSGMILLKPLITTVGVDV